MIFLNLDNELFALSSINYPELCFEISTQIINIMRRTAGLVASAMDCSHTEQSGALVV